MPASVDPYCRRNWGGKRQQVVFIPTHHHSHVCLQLPLLTNLHTLWYDNNERNDLAALSTLTSLSSLTLHNAKELPASLPNLTQLEQLEVYHPEALALSAVDEASLIEAVGQLQQLTCLGLAAPSPNWTSVAAPAFAT